eukprot:2971400-Rhodomonas_salina.1
MPTSSHVFAFPPASIAVISARREIRALLWKTCLKVRRTSDSAASSAATCVPISSYPLKARPNSAHDSVKRRAIACHVTLGSLLIG